MRAKEINFERGLDPKASLGIGGINFQETFDKVYDDWMSTLRSLEGKTITGEIEKYWAEIGGNPKEDFRKRSVKVKKFDNHANVESMGGGRAVNWKIYFYGDDGFRYSLNLDQKLNIQ